MEGYPEERKTYLWFSILLTELQVLLYEIKNKTTVFKIPYYSKYKKHENTFDHLIYFTCICKISLVQSK